MSLEVLQSQLMALRLQMAEHERAFNPDQARDAHGRFLASAQSIASRIALPHLPGMVHNAFLHVLEMGGKQAREAKQKLLGEAEHARLVAEAKSQADAAAKAMMPEQFRQVSDREQALRDARILQLMEATKLRTAALRIKTPALRAQRLAEAAAKKAEAEQTMAAIRVVRDQMARYYRAHGPNAARPVAKVLPGRPNVPHTAAHAPHGGHQAHSPAQQAAHTFHTVHSAVDAVLGKVLGEGRVDLAKEERFDPGQARDGRGRWVATDSSKTASHERLARAIGNRQLGVPHTLAEAQQQKATYNAEARGQQHAQDIKAAEAALAQAESVHQANESAYQTAVTQQATIELAGLQNSMESQHLAALTAKADGLLNEYMQREGGNGAPLTMAWLQAEKDAHEHPDDKVLAQKAQAANDRRNAFYAALHPLELEQEAAQQARDDYLRLHPHLRDLTNKAFGAAINHPNIATIYEQRNASDQAVANASIALEQLRAQQSDPLLATLDAHIQALTHNQRVVYVQANQTTMGAVDLFFGRPVTSAEIGALVGAQHGDTVTIEHIDASSISLRLHGYQGAYTASRYLRRNPDGSLVMTNNSFTVTKALQGKGIGVHIFASQVRGLRHMGVSHIQTDAAGEYGNKTYNGYYTWPAFGYNAKLLPAEQRSWQVQLGLSSPPKTVQDIFAQPGGAALWQLYGSGRDMAFNLNPHSRSSRALNSYLRTRKITVDDPLAMQRYLEAAAIP